MTNKALFGLVGGGSAAAGLGTGFGVGVNNKPFDYRNFINVFYSNLIEDAKIEIAEYEKMNGNDKKTFLEKYKARVCGIANDSNASYKAEGAKHRITTDKQLCTDSTGDFENHKPKWEAHFKNSVEDLKKEWAEFKKHIHDPKPPTRSE